MWRRELSWVAGGRIRRAPWLWEIKQAKQQNCGEMSRTAFSLRRLGPDSGLEKADLLRTISSRHHCLRIESPDSGSLQISDFDFLAKSMIISILV
jgi:hypothetical protein